MLSALRNSAKSWVAKILLLLLVASFAVWGVSGQITGGVGANTVLTAGDTSVDINEYRLAYDRAFRGFQARFGQQLTREQAGLFGIDNQVLSTLAAGAVLDEQARRMDLGLTREGLAQVISEDAQNWSAGGRFDRDLLRQVLRQIGMTEEDYVQTLESVAIREQVVEAAAADMPAPQVFLDSFFLHRGQSRDVAFFRVSPTALPDIAAPSDEELQTYFDENVAQYRAPEFRQLRYVRLTADALADPAAIAQSDVEQEYERTRDSFGQPERRTIQQLIFPDRVAAQQARERILAGEGFNTIAEELGRTDADITLGIFAQADVPDETLGQAAFALQAEGDISDIIDGAFGAILVRVTEITEERIAPLEEVENQIRQELALFEADDILQTVHNAYEEARAGGASLSDAAEAQRLDIVMIEAIDAQGRDPSGAAIDGPPEFQELVREAFQVEVLEESAPLQAGETGYLWYEVVDILPERDRSFDEVRDRVSADWIASQTSAQLDQEAQTLLARLADGESLAAIAEDTGYTLERKFGLSRDSDDGDFGRTGVAEVFSKGPNASGVVASADGNTRIVFAIETINQPLGDGQSLTEVERSRLSVTLADDILDQMVGRAQQEFSVTVNPQAIERANASGSL